MAADSRRGGREPFAGPPSGVVVAKGTHVPSLRLRPPPHRTGQADFRLPARREGATHRDHEAVRSARAFGPVCARRESPEGPHVSYTTALLHRFQGKYLPVLLLGIHRKSKPGNAKTARS